MNKGKNEKENSEALDSSWADARQDAANRSSRGTYRVWPYADGSGLGLDLIALIDTYL